ncbi:hypothetical protein [Alkaliphilus transvaalensis]|uniref:hypothetical protein n=1 Tax=Alkaliphilus transvaalensis TaxID=114628 RepID=UPI00047DA3F4|nr:hypothetical protein [Alkaliphilus transvaalensis]
MKKSFAVLLSLLLIFSLLAGCTNNTNVEVDPVDEDNNVSAPSEESIKVGLGTVNSIAKSKSYSLEGDKETLALGQVDTVIAAAAFDQDGKVVSVIIDNAQTRVNFDNEMQITNDLSAEIKTKAELLGDYGMARVSGIGKEWFEQIAELEKWMVGKTVAEIKAMKVKEVDAAHPAVPDVPELTSLVTITIQDYVAALEKAYNNAVEVEGFDKLGLGHQVSIAKSKGYSNKDGSEVLPLAQVDTVMAATAFDKDGKVVGTQIDNAQVRINFDAEGTITNDLSATIKTKSELGNDYGMARVSGIGKEWFEQMEELEKWMVGKTVAEIKGMKVKEVDAAHPAVPDIPELTSSVTITIQDYVAAVEEAYNTAR